MTIGYVFIDLSIYDFERAVKLDKVRDALQVLSDRHYACSWLKRTTDQWLGAAPTECAMKSLQSSVVWTRNA